MTEKKKVIKPFKNLFFRVSSLLNLHGTRIKVFAFPRNKEKSNSTFCSQPSHFVTRQPDSFGFEMTFLHILNLASMYFQQNCFGGRQTVLFDLTGGKTDIGREALP